MSTIFSLLLTRLLLLNKLQALYIQIHKNRLRNKTTGKFLWVEAWYVFIKSGIHFECVFWEGNLVHFHWLVYQIAWSLLAKTTQSNKTKLERNGIKHGSFDGVRGLEKELKPRTLPWGKCGWAILVEKSLAGPEPPLFVEKPHGATDGEVWEADTCRR